MNEANEAIKRKIDKAVAEVEDHTPTEACQDVLERLELFLGDMDDILPEEWAVRWAAILAKGIETAQKRNDKNRAIVRSIVTECLGGPSGDPDSSHCRAAALAIVLMEANGCDISGDDYIQDAIKNGLDGYYDWAKEEIAES